MTAITLSVKLAAAICMVAAIVFCVLYDRYRYHKRRLWWKSETGRNIMALAASVAVLASGSILRFSLPCLYVGAVVSIIGFVLVTAVLIWRSFMLWNATHPPRVDQRPRHPHRKERRR